MLEDNKYELDIRAEVLLNFVKNNFNIPGEKIKVNHLGAIKRRGGKDVLDFEVDKQLGSLEISLSRNGFFDVLPKHLLLSSVEGKDDNAAMRSKLIAEQIRDWRKFFSPFEKSIFLVLADFLQYDDLNHSVLFNQLTAFWGLKPYEDLFEKKQLAELFYWLPRVKQIQHDYQFIANIFQQILGNSVSIKTIRPIIVEMSDSEIKPLGKCHLGIDSMLGNAFSDGVLGLEITVEDLHHSNFHEFLSNGKKRRILEDVLIPIFLPVEICCKTKFTVNEDFDLGFMLPERKKPDHLQSILGYTTKLPMV